MQLCKLTSLIISSLHVNKMGCSASLSGKSDILDIDLEDQIPVDVVIPDMGEGEVKVKSGDAQGLGIGSWSDRYIKVEKGVICVFEKRIHEAQNDTFVYENELSQITLAGYEVVHALDRVELFQLNAPRGSGSLSLLMEAASHEKKCRWVDILSEHITFANLNNTSRACPALMRGWLRKQGGDASSGMFHDWKIRYFVIEKGVVKYYKDDSENYPYGMNLKGAVRLQGYTLDATLDKLEQFQLVAQDRGVLGKQRDLSMEADSFDTKKIWAKGLLNHIAYANGTYDEPEEQIVVAPSAETIAETVAAVEAAEAAAAAMKDVEPIVPPMHKGWLVKEGGNATSGSLFKNWKRRFFVVEAGILRYYEDEQENHPCELFYPFFFLFLILVIIILSL